MGVSPGGMDRFAIKSAINARMDVIERMVIALNVQITSTVTSAIRHVLAPVSTVGVTEITVRVSSVSLESTGKIARKWVR